MNKRTFHITHEDFRPDGDMPGQLRCRKVEAETLEAALRTPTKEGELLPDGLREMYRISVWTE